MCHKKTLSAMKQILYYKYRNAKCGFVTLSEIVKQTNQHRSTVCRDIRMLESKGAITKIKDENPIKGNLSNFYIVKDES